MIARYDLDAVVARAETACRRANDAFRAAQADLARANVEWGKFVSDRRMPGAVRDQTRPDRRNANADLAALSKAVADRQNAYAELSVAEAKWVRTEVTLAKAEAKLSRAEAKRDLAEAESGEVIAALDRFSVSNLEHVASGRIDIPVRRLAEASKRGSAGGPSSAKPGLHPVRDEEKRTRDASARRKSSQRFNWGLPPRVPNPVLAFIRSPLLRQSIGLSVLAAAYLQYWYFDVQVQIAGMPSIFMPLLR